ncbi:hypothetical protein [Delftia acidovorans]
MKQIHEISSENFTLDGVEQVVAEPLRFKAKLAIGENAYRSLRMVNRGRELWDVLGAAGTGAAVAKSSLVASTFFAPSGLLGAIGIGTAATPLGWVAFAALASGGACYGLYRMFANSRGSRVIEIPKFLNTPLDVLALSLFDLIAPLALRIAAVGGKIDQEQRSVLVGHLVEEWGFDPNFVGQAVPLLESQLGQGQPQDVAQELATFLHANPDCNHVAIAADLGDFLRSLLETGKPLSESEHTLLNACIATLSQVPEGVMSKAWTQARLRAAQVADGVGGTLREASKNLPSMEELRDAADSTVNQVRQSALRVGTLASQVLPEPAQLKEAARRSLALGKAGVDRIKNRLSR